MVLVPMEPVLPRRTKLRIYELRYTIYESAGAAGGFGGGDNYGEKFIALLHQAVQTGSFHKVAFHQQLHPEERFITLFLNDPKLIEKVRSRFGTADRAIIGPDRSSAAQELRPQRPRYPSVRQRLAQLHNAVCVLLCPCLHLIACHNVSSWLFPLGA